MVATIGTLLFMALLFLLLWFVYLSAPVPEQEEGIEVAFGEVEDAGGYMPEQSEALPLPSPQETAPVQPSTPAKDNFVTQEDPSLVLQRQKEKEERERKAREEQARLEAERKAKETAEAERKAKEEAERKKAEDLINGMGFGQGQGNSGTGNSGSGGGSNDNAAKGASGGGRDSRISGLGGRNTRDGKIPNPTCEYQHYGVVVVKIRIDKEGNVISAVNAAGTNTSDQQMIQCAINAIKNTKWTAGEGISEGTITYTFTVK